MQGFKQPSAKKHEEYTVMFQEKWIDSIANPDSLNTLDSLIEFLPPTDLIAKIRDFPDGIFSFDVNMSDMTEILRVRDNDIVFSYSMPFLSTFNSIVRHLADADYYADVVNREADYTPDSPHEALSVSSTYSREEIRACLAELRRDENIFYVHRRKAVFDKLNQSQKLKDEQFNVCSYVNDVIQDISSLPAHYSISQHLLYFTSTIAGNDFKTIPLAVLPEAVGFSETDVFQYARTGNMKQLNYALPTCTNWLDVINTSLFAIACSEKVLRKCKLCGKYFIPESRSDEMYCRFPNKDLGNKPCKEAYKRIAQDERERNNELLQLNKRIYNRLRSRSKKELTSYLKQRDRMKPKDKADPVSGAEYLRWLRKYDQDTRKR